MNDLNKTKIPVKCIDCGIEYECSYSTYNSIRRANPSNPQFRCSDCAKKFRAQKMKERMANMPPEEKAAMYKKAGDNHSKTLAKMSKEEKDARMARINAGRTEWLKNETEEERKRISKIHSESNRRRWESKSEEEKFQEREAAKERWANRSDEYKQRHSQYTIDMWKNKTEEEFKATKEKMSYAAYMKHANMSETEKRNLSAKIRATNIMNYESLSDEEKAEYAKKHMVQKRSDNLLCKAFVKLFNEYNTEKYELIPEFVISNEYNLRNKEWDYAIKRNCELIAVVDLDGELFHADNCDYRSSYNELKDASRGMSTPYGIIRVIIPEKNLENGVKYLFEMLHRGYIGYIHYNINMFSLMPFPYPKYSDTKLEDSFRALEKMDVTQDWCRDISLQPRFGDRIIQHFHESIWNDKLVNKKSPYEAWKSIDDMRHMVDIGYITQNHLNINKISQGFIFSDIAPRVDIFSAATAKIIINKYLSEFDTIFDPFSGYSSILLGAISSSKCYIGQDYSIAHVNEANKMIDFLKSHNQFIKSEVKASVTCQDVYKSSGEYPCLFTCPPSGSEIYKDVPISSNTCDDWVDICLNRFKCKRYIFIVKYTKKYSGNIVDMIETKFPSRVDRKFIIVIERN